MTTFLSWLKSDSVKEFIVQASIALCITLAPFVYAYAVHGAYTIPPELADDSRYYYSRMESIVEGHWRAGDAYYLEHVDDPSLAFFVPDIMSAVPRFLGFSLMTTVLINVVFWSLILVVLLALLGRELAFSRLCTRILIGLIFFSTLFQFIRPVSMQVVFPFFVFLLLALLRWLKNPTKASAGVLAIALIAPFYIYTYLWQIGAVIFGLLQCMFFMDSKRWQQLLCIDGAVIIGALPSIILTFSQLSHPAYWETVSRVGLVATHTFGSSGVMVLAEMILAGAVVFALGWKSWSRASQYFFVGVTIALGATTFSNVITGKDLETAVHAGRFVLVFVVLVSCIVLSKIRFKYFADHSVMRSPRVLFAVSGALLLIAYAGYDTVRIMREIPSRVDPGDRYMPVLAWINDRSEKNAVIFADTKLSQYFPVATHAYALFEQNGELNLMTDAEVKERYLLSHVFDTSPVDAQKLDADLRQFAGAGNAIHAYKTHNREVWICEHVFRRSCGTVQTAHSWLGDDYFYAMLRASTQLRLNPKDALERYQVRYVVRDEKNDQWTLPSNSFLEEIAHVGDFVIYKIK